MLTEDYVSFETAKLLKEKGFDEFCNYYYGPITDTDNEYKFEKFFTLIMNSGLIDDAYTAPTLQMAMKWLRETFKIHCQITYTILASGWIYDIHNLNKDEWWVTTFGNTDTYDTYEEACESAIKYILENLI